MAEARTSGLRKKKREADLKLLSKRSKPMMPPSLAPVTAASARGEQEKQRHEGDRVRKEATCEKIPPARDP